MPCDCAVLDAGDHSARGTHVGILRTTPSYALLTIKIVLIQVVSVIAVLAGIVCVLILLMLILLMMMCLLIDSI